LVAPRQAADRLSKLADTRFVPPVRELSDRPVHAAAQRRELARRGPGCAQVS
jgi:hypothetical protein